MEARITVTGIKDVDELVDVINKLESNTTIECKLETEKKQEENTEDLSIPERKRVLTDEEKHGLSNEEIFMREYGVYTSFCINKYWSEVFRAIYGYSPSLLV